MAKRLLKAQLVKADVGYEELSRRLKGMGTVMPAAVINRRINRGMFSAEFLLQCLVALEVKELPLGEDPASTSVPPRKPLAEELGNLNNGKVWRKK